MLFLPPVPISGQGDDSVTYCVLRGDGKMDAVLATNPANTKNNMATPVVSIIVVHWEFHWHFPRERSKELWSWWRVRLMTRAFTAKSAGSPFKTD